MYSTETTKPQKVLYALSILGEAKVKDIKDFLIKKEPSLDTPTLDKDVRLCLHRLRGKITKDISRKYIYYSLAQSKETEVVQLGIVGVDSGQLIIADPCYIEDGLQKPEPSDLEDHAHTIYRCTLDNKLWQFTYNGKPQEGVNKFPGSYETIIPEYGKKPNELVAEGIFTKTDMDVTPHIKMGEPTYRGVCKATTHSPNQGGQINFPLGHAGLAVAFSSGLGDGTYKVFAELIELKDWGKRVKKVWVELLTDEQCEEIGYV